MAQRAHTLPCDEASSCARNGTAAIVAARTDGNTEECGVGVNPDVVTHRRTRRFLVKPALLTSEKN